VRVFKSSKQQNIKERKDYPHYMSNLSSTGSKLLNDFLNGGYEKDVITTIYGPAGSGKTLFCMLAAINTAVNKKVIFVDTEGGFSLDRLKQLTQDYESILSKMVFFRPTSFKEQQGAFEKLKGIIDDKIGLVIIDTISMLYRVEMGKSDDIYGVNRELGQQISFLNEIVRKKQIPVLITNQVYADFEKKQNVKMVGGDILKYGSKCLIELKNLRKCMRIAILKKHRSISEEKSVIFRIINEGIEEVKEKRIF